MPGDALRIRLCEHGLLHRDQVGELRWQRLKRADRRVEQEHGGSVFEWSRPGVAQAKSFVGVLSVEGLRVEVLPKVDAEGREEEWAQRNLLHMLRVAGLLPYRETGVAGLGRQAGTLLDIFAWLFAKHLLEEWRRGPDRAYLRREENLRYLRGRILIPANLRRNALHRERFFVAHDVLEEDTPLNQLLKAAVRRLLATVKDGGTRHLLGVLLEEMAIVGDIDAREAATLSAPLGRLNERYRVLRDFARQVLGSSTPEPRCGDETTFSILFPMERVFESYVARTVRQWAPRLGISRARVRIQAAGDSRSLLAHVGSGRGRAWLRPDVWIEPVPGSRGIVIDTKWKVPGGGEAGMGMAAGDVYQMLAYAQAYDAERVLLVYPRYRRVEGETEWEFPGSRHRLRVVEWPVGGNLESTEDAMFLEAGAWFEPGPGLQA